MNLIPIEVPIHLVKENSIKGVFKKLNYSLVLDDVRVTNYNHSFFIRGVSYGTSNHTKD